MNRCPLTSGYDQLGIWHNGKHLYDSKVGTREGNIYTVLFCRCGDFMVCDRFQYVKVGNA